MKRKTILLLFPCLLALSSCSFTNSTTKVDDKELAKFDELRDTYSNSIDIPNASGSNLAADPFVLRYNGKYYMYPTGAGAKIRCYVSSDLVNWEPSSDKGLGSGICLSGKASSYPSGVGDYPYAPEVIYYDGYFYMVTSITGNGHFIFRSEGPEGPFVRISENLGKSIDGSFFIDSDEEIYFYGAGGNSISAYKLEDDFITFKKDNDKDYVQSLLECSMGAWTEGPYLLQKDSSYYLTYTGSHYLSRDYRVDYAYATADSDVAISSSFKRKDTVLLEVKDDYNGLGHSCTVLGPDLDSYYIVYHNLTNKGANRYLNVSRLYFNGSDMIASNVDTNDHFIPRLAEFEAYDDTYLDNVGNFILSSESTNKTFSTEFNVTGTDEMIFSFKDEKNYASISFDGTSITIKKIVNGSSNLVKKFNLRKEYDTTVNHTFRISYKANYLDLYFDNIALIDDLKVNLDEGKIGFKKQNTFDNIGYLAFSNVGQGSSDKEEYKSGTILASSFDDRLSYLTAGSGLNAIEGGTFRKEEGNNIVLANKGDRVTYRIYEDNANDYYINLRVPYSSIGKQVGIRINDKEVKTFTIKGDQSLVYKKGDVNVTLGKISLSDGPTNLSFVNVGDEFAFSRFDLEMVNDYANDEEIVFTNNVDLSNFTLRNNPLLTSKGLQTSIEAFNTITTKEKYNDYEINAKIQLNNFDSSGYFGFMLNANKYSINKDSRDAAYRSGNYDTNYQGIGLRIDGVGEGSLANVDYANNTPTYGGFSVNLNKNQEFTLSVIKENNLISVYFDDAMVYSKNMNVSSLSGILGFMSYKCDTYLKELTIKNLD